MMQSQCVEITPGSHAGHVRALVHGTALRMGGDEARAEQAATAAAELAANIARHTNGGRILLRELIEGPDCALELHALDNGPGIPNVGFCLRAETGLGSVRRLAGEFQIRTRHMEGTVVWIRLRITGAPSRDRNFDCAGISTAVAGEETCGDAWDVRECPNGVRAIVADGLGHGPLAATPSCRAISVFQRQAALSPSECLGMIHESLLHTRGAAASIAGINLAEGVLTMAGAGNVSVRLLGAEAQKTFAGNSGTLGAHIRKINDYRECWTRDSVLVLHSDGISPRWDPGKYPGLAGAHPALIAGVLHRDFQNRRDDSTVVVIRQRRPDFRGVAFDCGALSFAGSVQIPPPSL